MATFWEIAATRLAICSHCILSICNIYLFPALVLKAGFAFLMLQFLFIAFLLLLKRYTSFIQQPLIVMFIINVGFFVSSYKFKMYSLGC